MSMSVVVNPGFPPLPGSTTTSNARSGQNIASSPPSSPRRTPGLLSQVYMSPESRLESPSESMRSCATSADLVADIGTDGKLTVWQVWDTDRENLARGGDAGLIVQTLNASIDEYSACNWTCCAMSGDLLVAGNDGTTQRVTPERPGRPGAASLVVWNLKTGNKEQIEKTTIPISCCAIYTHPPARFSNTDNTLLRDRSLIVAGSVLSVELLLGGGCL